MGRKTEVLPCGTRAAYERHRRAGERPCEACTAAERERKRAQRHGRAVRDAKAVVQAVESGSAVPAGEYVVVRQYVGKGEFAQVPVPVFESELEAAVWLERRVNAALLVAYPRDVAALAKASMDCADRVARLRAAAEDRKPGLLDQLAARRNARQASYSERTPLAAPEL